MKMFFLSLFFGYLGILLGGAQTIVLSGKVLDALSNQPIEGVEITLEGTEYRVQTDNDGFFSFSEWTVPNGVQYLSVNRDNYLTQRLPIIVQQGMLENPILILLKLDLSQLDGEIGLINLSDKELEDDSGETVHVPGQLQASKDVFLKAVAYDFSASFYRLRGVNSENNKVFINGIEMNQLQSGRAQWNQWGGLNDAFRNQVYSLGFQANDYTFGDVGGTTHIMIRASKYRKGGQVSLASANRSYTRRLMGSYFSGRTLGGWAYGIVVSQRAANEGYIEGTNYKANSFFLSVEKELNDIHSINLTAFYTPVTYGRSAALTDEVISLKGLRYNPNWGYQEGQMRNSKQRRVKAPLVMLSHYWFINERTSINSNLSYQLIHSSDTRLDNAGFRNPMKNYYQRMPSYFLRSSTPSTYDYQLAHLAEKEFMKDGQLDWNALYDSNLNAATGYSRYVLQEDRNDDTILAINSFFVSEIKQGLSLIGSLHYRSLQSKNYATINDLLGGNGWLDVDTFYNGTEENFNQSDARNPNQIVQEDEVYKYNYKIGAVVYSGFAQGEWKNKHFDLYLGGKLSFTNYQRSGLFQNGYFQEGNRSLGKSTPLSFTTFGIKGGGTYKLTGHHLFQLHIAMMTKPPTLRNSFANLRQNNDPVSDLTFEKIKNLDVGHEYHSPFIMSRIRAYYVEIENQTNISYFFTQNAIGLEENSAFVQEIVQGITRRNIGIEWGCETQLLPSLKLKASVAWGQNRYVKNPSLYLSGDDYDYDTSDGFVEGNDLKDRGKRTVYLENHHSSGGPEQAYQLGFEYRDPDYWWVGVTSNYFSNTYVNISYLRRSEDFAMDTDNQPYANYNPTTAKYLLRQEQLDSYGLVNIIGGKSWRINNYYLGFFASINNILNQRYRTGGFEDSRKASYPQQIEELSGSGGPLFGNRYFSGNGTTYYLNLFVRF
jgi:Carboxypeptidase regulatory-like domain